MPHNLLPLACALAPPSTQEAVDPVKAAADAKLVEEFKAKMKVGC